MNYIYWSEHRHWSASKTGLTSKSWRSDWILIEKKEKEKVEEKKPRMTHWLEKPVLFRNGHWNVNYYTFRAMPTCDRLYSYNESWILNLLETKLCIWSSASVLHQIVQYCLIVIIIFISDSSSSTLSSLPPPYQIPPPPYEAWKGIVWRCRRMKFRIWSKRLFLVFVGLLYNYTNNCIK